MLFNANNNSIPLSKELENILFSLRKRRAFNPKLYIEEKTVKLNKYMAEHKLSSCVVAVSGGIDSAVVLGIVCEAAKKEDSPIKKIVPVTLPIFKDKFTSNQSEATKKAINLMNALSPKKESVQWMPLKINLTSAFEALKSEVDESCSIEGLPWAAGQLVSYLRTPTYYYITSLLTQQKLPGVVVGTTNRDEGAYLGFFGKASDGMVDIQLISDLHKSEVFKVGGFLSIPKEILYAVPTGDMFDNRPDEDVFGATYDSVELFLQMKCLSEEEKTTYLSSLNNDSKKQFNDISEKLERLHAFNKHKYLGKSPAVHLDILESGVPGGWPIEIKESSKIINEFTLNKPKLSDVDFPNQECSILKDLDKFAATASGILRNDEIKDLLNQVKSWVPVAVNGYMRDYKNGDEVGSWRASAFSEEWAAILWQKIAHIIPPTITLDNSIWVANGVSSLLRFIKYEDGGFLVPHYDYPFEFKNKNRTFLSLVLFLTAPSNGGATRFIKDPQKDKRLSDMDLSDWNRKPFNDEILLSVNPNPGSALIFDHFLLHDGESVIGQNPKIIIRTDVVYKPC